MPSKQAIIAKLQAQGAKGAMMPTAATPKAPGVQVAQAPAKKAKVSGTEYNAAARFAEIGQLPDLTRCPVLKSFANERDLAVVEDYEALVKAIQAIPLYPITACIKLLRNLIPTGVDVALIAALPAPQPQLFANILGQMSLRPEQLNARVSDIHAALTNYLSATQDLGATMFTHVIRMMVQSGYEINSGGSGTPIRTADVKIHVYAGMARCMAPTRDPPPTMSRTELEDYVCSVIRTGNLDAVFLRSMSVERREEFLVLLIGRAVEMLHDIAYHFQSFTQQLNTIKKPTQLEGFLTTAMQPAGLGRLIGRGKEQWKGGEPRTMAIQAAIADYDAALGQWNNKNGTKVMLQVQLKHLHIGQLRIFAKLYMMANKLYEP